MWTHLRNLDTWGLGKQFWSFLRGGQLIRSRHSVLSCHIRYRVWEWQAYPRTDAVLGTPALDVCRRFVRESMGTQGALGISVSLDKGRSWVWQMGFCQENMVCWGVVHGPRNRHFVCHALKSSKSKSWRLDLQGAMGTVPAKERKDLSGPPWVLPKHADPVRPFINSWCRHMYSVLIFKKCP